MILSTTKCTATKNNKAKNSLKTEGAFLGTIQIKRADEENGCVHQAQQLIKNAVDLKSYLNSIQKRKQTTCTLDQLNNQVGNLHHSERNFFYLHKKLRPILKKFIENFPFDVFKTAQDLAPHIGPRPDPPHSLFAYNLIERRKYIYKLTNSWGIAAILLASAFTYIELRLKKLEQTQAAQES